VQAFRKDISQATDALVARSARMKSHIARFFVRSLTANSELMELNSSFLHGWLMDMPASDEPDPHVDQLTSIVQTSEAPPREEVECPICQETLTVRRDENGGTTGELICSMWHVWSEYSDSLDRPSIALH
jgi:hypothetical protein